MTIHCAIIDDEPLAAGLLKSYAIKTPFLNLVGTYGSALEAMKELRDNPVQPRSYLPKPRLSSPPPSSSMPSKATRSMPWTIC